ncbi:MAG: hypothetical protein N3A58_04100 [Spirochaetes bacterium]|nr:hypothetical protein [Spirochaetota bacterium]
MRKVFILVLILIISIFPLKIYSQEQADPNANSLSFDILVGTVIGSKIGFNIDFGFSYFFYLGSKLPWSTHFYYHVVFGGWGFAFKTGPVFYLNKMDNRRIFAQAQVGLKGEMITGLNYYGDFFVPIIEINGNIISQILVSKSNYINFGIGLYLIISLGGGPLPGGVAIAFNSIFSYGFYF